MHKAVLFSLAFLCILGLHGQEQAYKAGKLSPATAHFIREYKQAKLDTAERQTLLKRFAVKQQGKVTYTNVFIKLEDDCDIQVLKDSFGVRIKTMLPTLQLMTASVPADYLEKLAMYPGVEKVELGLPVTQNMDNARAATQVDKVQQGLELPNAYKGKNVVIGIIDGGFQYDHLNFYDSLGNLRIKRVLDANITDEDGNYATFETEADIIEKKYDYHASSQETHATHVAGIAAGSYTGNNYYGVAPETELVFVSADNSNNTSILDGIKYVYDYAESVGKPAVVNMSLGSHVGPHDGTSFFDQACDELQGPGRLLVGSAGNEGDSPIHIAKDFNATDSVLQTFLELTAGTYGVIDLWGNPGEAFSIEPVGYKFGIDNQEIPITDAPINASQNSENTFSLKNVTGGSNDAIAIYTRYDETSGKANDYVIAGITRNSPLYAVGLKITSTKGTVHGWATNCTLSSKDVKGWTNGDANHTVGEIGGTGKRIISVGAYVSKNNFTNALGQSMTATSERLDSIATFSSMGPTVDGRMKPDITAPGCLLISSYTDKTSSLFSTYRQMVVSRDENAYYGAMQGTSMSAPFVTGVLATWLEAKPDLTPEEVRNVLRSTSISDQYTGSTENGENYTWGYGKINSWAGIREIIKLTTQIANNEKYGDIAVTQDLAAKQLFLHFYKDVTGQLTIRLYTLGGQLADSRDINITDSTLPLSIDLSPLPAGLYVLDAISDSIQFAPQKIVVK